MIDEETCFISLNYEHKSVDFFYIFMNMQWMEVIGILFFEVMLMKMIENEYEFRFREWFSGDE